ncbi:MAG TPA: aspartate kinase [Limnochordia bacterium]|nr:aspartate kinase [Limnochordia bacterium]
MVQKYGGSSVATPEKIQNVARRVIENQDAGWSVAVVVSALGDTTDELIALARQLNERPPKREMDMLLSTGEQISIALLAMAISAKGREAISFTGPQAGIQTDRSYSKARIQRVDPLRVQAALSAGKIAVVAGFQGLNDADDITTLGRGGSDTTAVALAAALDAEVCEIYTDVEGVFTADPRVEPQARKLRDISYGEMLEMASLGAVVLQPRSVEYGAIHGVPIHVRSTFSTNPGTMVREDRILEKDMMVVGCAHDTNVAKITVLGVPDRPGVAAALFSRLAEEGVNVDMIVQTNRESQATDMLFSVSHDDLPTAKEATDAVARDLGAQGTLCDERVAKVSIVGAGMVSNPGVAAKMFSTLAAQGVNIQVISTSEIKISCLIAADQVKPAVRAIHAAFELGEPPAF